MYKESTMVHDTDTVYTYRTLVILPAERKSTDLG